MYKISEKFYSEYPKAHRAYYFKIHKESTTGTCLITPVLTIATSKQPTFKTQTRLMTWAMMYHLVKA